MKKTPYGERSDLDKVKSNWKKARGLYRREEWSTTILRSVTAVELTANYVIRKELMEKRSLDKDFVNHLLKWSNGIYGKFDKLILPLNKKSDELSALKALKNKVRDINTERNSIAHSGSFKKRTTAWLVMETSKEIIEELVSLYEEDFTLKMPNQK